ncbi:FHA domain-containing protein [Anaerolineales bacterium HSG24]|nr:FHA domain-containing protein [Anaerolineales bacterium HSG24]
MNQPPSDSESNASEESQGAIQLQLVVHAGPLAGKGFPLTGNILTFGRDEESDISLDDEQVSRNHARLIRRGNKVIIEDLGSTNGTLVNGNRIEGQHTLESSDIISIGSSIFGVKGFAAPPTIARSQASPGETYIPPVAGTLPPMDPSPPSKPPSHPHRRKKPRKQKSSGMPTTSLLLAGIGLALVVVVLLIGTVTLYILSQGYSSSTPTQPTTIITMPVNNSQVEVNNPVAIQTTASDPNGVVRIELWLAGRKINEETSPSPQGQSTLTTSFQWLPNALGNHVLEVRAYNSQGAVSIPTAVTVNVVDPAASPTETSTAAPEPTFTLIPETSTPPPPSVPSLVALVDAKVQSGPDFNYNLLGLLPSQATAEIVGQNETRQWWQIRFAPASNGVGWVLAELTEASNTQNVPIILAPPTPTPIATDTPTPTLIPADTDTPTPTIVPATEVPTNTPIPPTETPVPTVTPTSTIEATVIDFDIFPREVNIGTCVRIRWNVTGVREIYLQDTGVAGSGDVENCPDVTTTYRLRVIKPDDHEEFRDITITVINNEVKSSGSMTIRRNRVADFDDGDADADDENDGDFEWSIDGETRHFKIYNSSEMAVIGDFNSLDDVDKRDCEHGNYDLFTFVDASTFAPDPNNTLIGGRVICYFTNEGRMGKLRFPEYNTGALDVEWLTWHK